MTSLKPNQIQKIRYTKLTGESGTQGRFEVTERVIIPTFVPKTNIKALDVTDLSANEREVLVRALKEYSDYLKARACTTFTFEDWFSQTLDAERPNIKWRTFKIEDTEVI